MSTTRLNAEGAAIHLSGSNLTYAFAVLVISLAALVVAFFLRKQVLAASEGTPKMKEIAAAIQEGASAYLSRQFKTLSVFVVLVFFILFALPGTADIRIGRSLFFLIGAVFSALVGYNGMWLAVRANVRVAAAVDRVVPKGASVGRHILPLPLNPRAESGQRHCRTFIATQSGSIVAFATNISALKNRCDKFVGRLRSSGMRKRPRVSPRPFTFNRVVSASDHLTSSIASCRFNVLRAEP
ncbi:K(+)-insensitive pyrophosphate-energized proton pump [mine drainage metagenome]|uniref:K(+)-insensitive pyrophosphate-energized proton pump n=1 Tax=mine drainage metagenome TaxID=410659 RepID=A0A1J5Q542_9ZZZZ